jgi:hypothetical protein
LYTLPAGLPLGLIPQHLQNIASSEAIYDHLKYYRSFSPIMIHKNKKESCVFVILALATASMMWMGIELPQQQQAVAQSPMDMMNMMMGRGGNMTDGSMMMGLGGGNMSMPFNMGVVIMPTMCTTPGQLLGSMTGMMGDEMFGGDGNATQQMMMGLMGQQMMSGGGMENMTELGGMENMTDSDMQKAMNIQICFPMMGEGMMQHMQNMMGTGQNSTGGMMNEMMMQ